MQNEMNMNNEMHKCVPRNGQINLSAQDLNRKKIAGSLVGGASWF